MWGVCYPVYVETYIFLMIRIAACFCWLGVCSVYESLQDSSWNIYPAYYCAVDPVKKSFWCAVDSGNPMSIIRRHYVSVYW